MEIPTGSDLRKARKERGLTQAELARRAGVSQPLIARIEGDDIDTTLETMHEVVSAINGSDSSVDHEKLEVLLQSSLKDAREQAGLTQGELADKAGVSQPLISRIENHDLNPRVSTLRSLLEYLDPLPTDGTTPEATTAASTRETSLLTEIQSDFDALRGEETQPDAESETQPDPIPSCDSCGSDLTEISDPTFCPHCGTRLEGADS